MIKAAINSIRVRCCLPDSPNTIPSERSTSQEMRTIDYMRWTSGAKPEKCKEPLRVASPSCMADYGQPQEDIISGNNKRLVYFILVENNNFIIPSNTTLWISLQHRKAFWHSLLNEVCPIYQHSVNGNRNLGKMISKVGGLALVYISPN